MSALPKHAEEQAMPETGLINDGHSEQTQLPVEVPHVLSPGAARVLSWLHPEQFIDVPAPEVTELSEEEPQADIRESFNKRPRSDETAPWYIKLSRPLLPKPKPVAPSPRMTLSDRLGDVEYPEHKPEVAAETEVQTTADETAPLAIVEPGRFSVDGLKKIVPALKSAKENIAAIRNLVAESFTMPKMPEISRRELNVKERAGSVKRWFGREIKEHRNATVVVLGLGGAALAAVLASKASMPHLGSESVQSHVQEHTQNAPTHQAEAGITHFDAVHQAMIAIRVTNAHHVAKAVQKAKEIKETLSYSGDTVWGHVSAHLQAKLGHMPSNEMVQKVTDKVLKSNHWSWDKAAHLPKGTVIHIQEKFLTFKHGSAKISS